MSDDEQIFRKPEPGGMRFQDGSTTPREPSLAERKARERAEARMRDEERRRREAEMVRYDKERRAKKRTKRILIGAGVTVGIVAVVAVGYAVAQPREQVEAQCVDEETDEIVDDSNCVTPASGSSSYNGSGGGFYPIFIGNGGRQYHYNYGGSGSIGQRVSGGTTTVPSGGTRVFTSSGRDITPSRSGSTGSSSGSGGSSASSSSGGSDSASSSSSGISRGGLGSSSSSSSGS